MGYFLHFYQSPKNQNFEKIKKTTGDIILLHTCTKNQDQIMYSSRDMLRDGQTDGRMDGKKGRIEVGAPPKNVKNVNNCQIIAKKCKKVYNDCDCYLE